MKKKFLRIENHQTLREKIVNSIREAIIKGVLEPGEKVPEPELARRFGTSRTPIRESFRQLESEGFLTVIPRKGAIVRSFTKKDIEEFYAIKALLEGYAARIAVEKITEDDIKKMEILNDKLERVSDIQDLKRALEIHNEFHEVFIKACGNDKLYRLIDNLVSQFSIFRFSISQKGRIEGSIEQHKAIIDAFKKRDSELVEKLVRENAMYGRDVLIREMKE
jgi:DNA-binding GntR family transcriptional regulator